MKEVSRAVRIRINPTTSLAGICCMPYGEIVVQNNRDYVTEAKYLRVLTRELVSN